MRSLATGCSRCLSYQAATRRGRCWVPITPMAGATHIHYQMQWSGDGRVIISVPPCIQSGINTSTNSLSLAYNSEADSPSAKSWASWRWMKSLHVIHFYEFFEKGSLQTTYHKIRVQIFTFTQPARPRGCKNWASEVVCFRLSSLTIRTITRGFWSVGWCCMWDVTLIISVFIQWSLYHASLVWTRRILKTVMMCMSCQKVDTSHQTLQLNS